MASGAETEKRQKRGVPEGLWVKCPGCQQTIYKQTIDERLGVCPECEHHFYVSAQQRIIQVLDTGTFEELDADLMPTDPLEFEDKKKYVERLVAEQKRTGLSDAALTGTGMIRARLSTLIGFVIGWFPLLFAFLFIYSLFVLVFRL